MFYSQVDAVKLLRNIREELSHSASFTSQRCTVSPLGQAHHKLKQWCSGQWKQERRNISYISVQTPPLSSTHVIEYLLPGIHGHCP